MTPERIAEMRAQHVERDNGCPADGFVWPCDTAAVLAALAAASEREQAYRAALTFYADEATYRCQWAENGSVTPIDEDHGDQARAILAAGGPADEGRVR